MQPDNLIGLKKLYQEGYLSIAQPDFTHCGGLMEAKKMSAMAEAFYLKIAPHNSSGPIATIASGHVDITLPNFYMQEFVYQKNVTANELYFRNSLKLEDGFMELGNAPGLGIEVDLEALVQMKMNEVY